MLGTGVSALRALVPSATAEACALAIVSLLRRYTTGLSLAVAADELERGPAPASAAVYRGRVTHVTATPLATWHLAGVPAAVLYVHSRLGGVSALDSVVRLRVADAQSLADSPASVVAAARRTLGDAKVVLYLPTRHIVLERSALPAALSLQDVWTRRELAPQAVQAAVADIDGDGAWVRLVDVAKDGAVPGGEETLTQPSVLWRLQECAGIAELLAVGEVVVVTAPSIVPTGQSFEIVHGAESVVYCMPKADGVPRPQKRARTSVPGGVERAFFGYEIENGAMDIEVRNGAIGRGMVTVAGVREDFRDGVVATSKHGHRLAFGGEQSAARALLPGTSIWLDGAAWNETRGVWIVHSFANLSEMTALLHSPFVRDVAPLRTFEEIARNRGCCTVQACVRILGIKSVDDSCVSLKVADIAQREAVCSQPNGDACACILLARERMVRALFDRSISSLKDAFKGEGQSWAEIQSIPKALLMSIVISTNGEDGGRFQYYIGAASPAPGDW